MRDTALDRVIELAGGIRPLASKLGGITPQAISQWERVPATRVLKVCAAVGGEVKPHELRPDIYPAPEETAAE